MWHRYPWLGFAVSVVAVMVFTYRGGDTLLTLRAFPQVPRHLTLREAAATVPTRSDWTQLVGVGLDCAQLVHAGKDTYYADLRDQAGVESHVLANFIHPEQCSLAHASRTLTGTLERLPRERLHELHFANSAAWPDEIVVMRNGGGPDTMRAKVVVSAILTVVSLLTAVWYFRRARSTKVPVT